MTSRRDLQHKFSEWKEFQMPKAGGATLSRPTAYGPHGGLMAWSVNNSLRKLFFLKEICAIMASNRGFGLKERNFGRFFRARGHKNLFWIAVAQAAP
jgi:hypothetical protein